MRDIRYKWNEGPNSVGVSSEVSLPQFKVLGHRQRAMEISLTTGTCRRSPIIEQFIYYFELLTLTESFLLNNFNCQDIHTSIDPFLFPLSLCMCVCFFLLIITFFSIFPFSKTTFFTIIYISRLWL